MSDELDKNDEYEDLKGLAFQHGADSPRGRQERKLYREGQRIGIGGVKTWVDNTDRHKEHR